MSEEVFVDRLSHVGVVTPPGERKKGKFPAWLSAGEIVCPKCGRVEYGNIDQEKIKLCSLCLMNEVFRAEGQERLAGPPLAAKRRGFRIVRESKNCERCGQGFRGRSNSQRFCERCQAGNANMKNRERQARFQKDQKNGHGLTV